MFTSLDQVKVVAEKFDARKIVPRRVLRISGKGEKKARSNLVFTRNVYRLQGTGGYHVFLVDFKESPSAGNYFIELKGNYKNLHLQGKSYGKAGNHFIGNYGVSDDECLRNINQAVYGKKVIEL